MTSTPKPLARDDLPEAPENLGWFRQYDGTWKLEYIGSGRCDEFRPDNIADLRDIASCLERANGLETEADGERRPKSPVELIAERFVECRQKLLDLCHVTASERDIEYEREREDRLFDALKRAVKEASPSVSPSKSDPKRLVAQGAEVEAPQAERGLPTIYAVVDMHGAHGPIVLDAARDRATAMEMAGKRDDYDPVIISYPPPPDPSKLREAITTLLCQADCFSPGLLYHIMQEIVPHA